MSGEKRKFSVLCLVGFIISLLPIVVLVFNDFLSRWLKSFGLNMAYTVLPFVGLIVSIIGVVSARKKGKTGKGFGIAGIVLPGIGISLALVILVPLTIRTIERQNDEIYSSGEVKAHLHTEYNVGDYRLPEGYCFTGITVTEEELNEYAEDKLETITSRNSMRIRGTLEGYNFIIIRSDQLELWFNAVRHGGFQYDSDYATIIYNKAWELGASRPAYLDVYKDPSDKFIIVTNCGDYKIISEFFG